MEATIQMRRDTAANWVSANPVLASGEIGIVTDGNMGMKVGDGVTAWNALQFLPLKMEFSSNGVYWHFPPENGDQYIRFPINDGNWTDAIQWRGTDGVSPLGFTWFGEWDGYYPYGQNTIVWRHPFGSSVWRGYIALEQIGDGEPAPELDSRWGLLWEAYSFIWTGAYDAGTTYKKNIVVSRLNKVYISLTDDNLNNAPESSPTYWDIMVEGIQGEKGDQGDPATSGLLTYREVNSVADYEVPILATDTFINFDSEINGGMNLNLPQASTVPAGKIMYFKDSHGYGGSADVYVHPYLGDTIDNSGDVVLNNGYDRLILVCDGVSNWMKIGLGWG